MRRFETRRPSKIKLSEDSLIPTLQKLEILQQRYSNLQKLLKVCENEKSSLKFEIAKLNKKVTRLGSEKADINSELMKTIYSGKKKQTRKRKKKEAGATISALKPHEKKEKLKEYLIKIHNNNNTTDDVINTILELRLHDKDYGIIMLGVLEYLRDRTNGLAITITDNYVTEKFELAKNLQEDGTRALSGKKSRKNEKKKL